jgi:hypothetical protein
MTYVLSREEASIEAVKDEKWSFERYSDGARDEDAADVLLPRRLTDLTDRCNTFVGYDRRLEHCTASMRAI